MKSVSPEKKKRPRQRACGRATQDKHSKIYLKNKFDKVRKSPAISAAVLSGLRVHAFLFLPDQKLSAEFAKKGRGVRGGLRFLRWPDEYFADERLRRLRYQHRHSVRHILRLQHLRGIFPGVRAQVG